MIRPLKISIFALFLVPAFLSPFAGYAANSEKIEITADGFLEWHRDKKKFIAKKNVSAEHNNTIIYCSNMTADYQDREGKGFNIKTIKAEGNVRIEKSGNVALGDRAVYNTSGRKITMTGKNLSLITPEQTIKASDSFVYHTGKGSLEAFGNASVIQEGSKLYADHIVADFHDKGSNRSLRMAKAEGNVIIKTPTETLYGDSGIYRSESDIAEITGNVRIERGPNILEGERGEINLATNVSRLFGGSDSNSGRVRGVFFPDDPNATNVTPE
jgi:lipopolysaccharide export system protein LptA